MDQTIQAMAERMQACRNNEYGYLQDGSVSEAQWLWEHTIEDEMARGTTLDQTLAAIKLLY